MIARRPLLAASLGAAPFFVLLACRLLTITIEHEDSAMVEGAGVLAPLLEAIEFTGLDDVDVEIVQELEDQGVEAGDLRRLVLTAFELSAEPDLSFIESMDVWVSAEGIDEVRVASGRSFPRGQAKVALSLDEVDLVEQVVAGGLRFRVAVEGSAPAQDTEVGVRVEVEATATPKGACRQAKASD